ALLHLLLALLRALDALLEALLAALEPALAPLHPLLGPTGRREAEADLLERLIDALERLCPVPGVLGTGGLQVLARGLERLLGSLHVRVLLGADRTRCQQADGDQDEQGLGHFAAPIIGSAEGPDPNIPEIHEVLLERARALHPELTIADDAPSRFKKEGAAAPAPGAPPAAAAAPAPQPAPKPAAPASVAPSSPPVAAPAEAQGL